MISPTPPLLTSDISGELSRVLPGGFYLVVLRWFDLSLFFHHYHRLVCPSPFPPPLRLVSFSPLFVIFFPRFFSFLPFFFLSLLFFFSRFFLLLCLICRFFLHPAAHCFSIYYFQNLVTQFTCTTIFSVLLKTSSWGHCSATAITSATSGLSYRSLFLVLSVEHLVFPFLCICVLNRFLFYRHIFRIFRYLPSCLPFFLIYETVLLRLVRPVFIPFINIDGFTILCAFFFFLPSFFLCWFFRRDDFRFFTPSSGLFFFLCAPTKCLRSYWSFFFSLYFAGSSPFFRSFSLLSRGLCLLFFFFPSL